MAVDLVAVQRRIHERLGKSTLLERGKESQFDAAAGAGATREVHRDRLVEAFEVVAAVRALTGLVDGGQIKQVMELGLVNDIGELPLGDLVGEIDQEAWDRRHRDPLVDGHVARVQVRAPM